MSHTMNIEIEMHDRDAIVAACKRLNIRVEEGKHKLYSTTEEGLAIFLDGWKYPAIVKKDGSVAVDTYGGKWGDEQKLSELKAFYGLEKAKAEARKRGYSVYESRNDRTQELELRISLGGGVAYA